MKPIRRLLPAMLAAAALVLAAGCGSSDEDSSSSPSGKPRTATFGGPDNGRPVKPTTPGSGANDSASAQK